MCACAHSICLPSFLPADFKEGAAGQAETRGDFTIIMLCAPHDHFLGAPWWNCLPDQPLKHHRISRTYNICVIKRGFLSRSRQDQELIVNWARLLLYSQGVLVQTLCLRAILWENSQLFLFEIPPRTKMSKGELFVNFPFVISSQHVPF
jgi:hypothetical protein